MPSSWVALCSQSARLRPPPQVDSHHAGIVICTHNPDFDVLAQRIHKAILAAPALNRVLIRVYKK
jgi:hypothetical protein